MRSSYVASMRGSSVIVTDNGSVLESIAIPYFPPLEKSIVLQNVLYPSPVASAKYAA